MPGDLVGDDQQLFEEGLVEESPDVPFGQVVGGLDILGQRQRLVEIGQRQFVFAAELRDGRLSGSSLAADARFFLGEQLG